MLKLKNVCKWYKVGKNKNVILENINLDFKMGELVFILGPSGSGKSTLLNIIAGNLKCDNGEVWLNNICVSKLSDRSLDSYRSNIVSNIFQDYNLIEYMSVIDNIHLAYNGKKNRIVNDILKKLDIYGKRKIIVNKLSGGEKQRVAIARALVNDKKIILADEPTGSLDSNMGDAVMKILKEISKDKLVIVVSHDNYLANKYASRIINIKDGKCVSLPIIDDNNIVLNLKRVKSRLFSIFKMSVKNLWLKKFRTLFTSLALSLGIICMLLVSNLYYNFNNEIKNMERDVVSAFPISVTNGEFEILDSKVKSSNDKIIIKDRNKIIHTNIINENYLNYLNDIKEIKYMIYHYDIMMPFVSEEYKIIDNSYLECIPNDKYIVDNFKILYGRNINNNREVLIKVDSNNNIDSRLLNYFNINTDIDYDKIIGKKIKVILNNQYYSKNGNYYIINNDLNQLYNDSNINLTIVGVIKEKNVVNENNYIYYDNSLLKEVLDINSKSDIVKSQLINNYNVLGIDVKKDEMLSMLGYNSLPSSINIYVSNLDDKEKAVKYLDKYNKDNNKLIYVDMMSSAIDIVRQFINVISLILGGFSIISIIISCLMISILTNIRVLERKKEIGILRSLGRSKRDIRKLFNFENIIIGLLALGIGLLVSVLMVKPINNIIYNYLDISNIFKINYYIVGLVFLINIILIRICGIIPIYRASRLDIVKCIYNK